MGEDRRFLRALFALALPAIVQSLLTQAVGMADTLMLSVVGQTQLAAVSLANQLLFVLNMFFAGLTGSSAAMLSQYMGKGDEVRVRRIFTQTCAVSEAVCACFALAALCAPRAVMRLLTDDISLIELGGEYLRIAGVSYLFMGVSQIYFVLLKARKEARRSMSIAVMTLLVNVALNALLIFGLFGLPAMGIRGAALATCIARALEMLVCLIDAARRKVVAVARRFEPALLWDFVRICAPLTAQGCVWGGAMTAFSAIMGRLGADMVAAHAVAAHVQNVATVALFALAEAGTILLSRTLGTGDLARAKRQAVLLLRAAVALGAAGGALMLLVEGIVTPLFALTGEAPRYLGVMYKVLAVNAVFIAITNTTLCGIFPAGGDTRYGLLLDGAVMWSLAALGAIAAFVLKLHPIAVFLVLNIDELTKTPLVLLRFKKDTWLRNITRE